MKKYLNALNIVFSANLALTALIILNFIPREFAFVVLLLSVFYVIFWPTKNGVELFLRSIPFFIALPITADFDSLNIWRVLIIVIFLKWFFERWSTFSKFKVSGEKLYALAKSYRFEVAGIAFFTTALVSLFIAENPIEGMRRWVYMVNAALLFVVLASLIRENVNDTYDFIKNFAYSGIFAVVFGYIQFVAAYFASPEVFHSWASFYLNLGMYGQSWADITMYHGNTWFDYDPRRLRMFSTFPDTHSFPMYVIMTLPALAVVVFSRFRTFNALFNKASWQNLKNLFKDFNSIVILIGFALVNLALILTGTRGIWLSSLCTIAVLFMFSKNRITRAIYNRFGISDLFYKRSQKLYKILAGMLVLFLLMFPVYILINSFPQFQDTEFDTSAATGRLASTLDTSELSNHERIYIWKKSIESFIEKPILGVGMGNYPQVLDENIEANHAGASAHNLYLHIATTIGIFGLLAFIWLLVEMVIMAFRFIKRNSKYSIYALFYGVLLYSLSWIAGYSMTDFALYDGRALLAFSAITGIAVGVYHINNRQFLKIFLNNAKNEDS